MKVTPGISFAIPIDYAKDFLQKSQEKEGLYKKKHRRFMGVTMLAITPQTIPQLKQKIGLPPNLEHGIVVYQVVQVCLIFTSSIWPFQRIENWSGPTQHVESNFERVFFTNLAYISHIRQNHTTS